MTFKWSPNCIYSAGSRRCSSLRSILQRRVARLPNAVTGSRPPLVRDGSVQLSFRQALVTTFGASSIDEVQLTVSAGSIVVNARMIMPSESAAQAAAQQISTSSVASLSSSLAHTVEGVAAPSGVPDQPMGGVSLKRRYLTRLRQARTQ